MNRPSVLMLSAERPYPLHGGGAYRTASLLHYFAGFADVDLILLSENPDPAPVPAGLLRRQQVITLAPHDKSPFARYLRNAGRAWRGVPPLIDRLSGLDAGIESAIGERHYDLSIAEHFWCAPYIDLLARCSTQTVLDLHNIESEFHRSCAEIDRGMIALGQRRFASVARKMERDLYASYSVALTTSDADAIRVRDISPNANPVVYRNALPSIPVPEFAEQNTIVFTANFEYHPNVDAVAFLLRDIWPQVRRRHPEVTLRLVGRGDETVRHLVKASGSGVHLTGPLPDIFPEICRAKVVIAPLRAGSGTRIKILEGWAAQRPVVATSLAAEGLDARHGENILLSDHADGFAAAIVRLLDDGSLRTALGTVGRRTFEAQYSWNAAWKGLESRFSEVCLRNGAGYTGTI